ncbi:hypothetical protein ABZ079_28970 [Streptomyces sp. NPDC006314]|uniref:hypothetical protein n=1 Tax=Streptomyces sp. NPDC006314 TaxID=3154475 RepID=UPI0033A35DB8
MLSRQPTPEEAALALDEVRRRRGEAVTARREPQWLQITWAVVLLGCFASYDVFDHPGNIPWIVPLALLMLQLALSSTRRGAALLGLSSSGPHSAPAHYVTAISVIVVLVMAGSVMFAWPGTDALDEHVPYWHTLTGLAGLTLVMLLARKGTALQRRLLETGSKGRA